MRSLLLVTASLTLAGCETLRQESSDRFAFADLATANGSKVGTVALVRAGDDTTLTVTYRGAANAVHGVHLHTTGRCEAPFTSAGGHLNPSNRQHGTENPQGSHLGDLPNLRLNGAGVGSISAKLGASSADLQSALFDGDGTAIVVHADPDDYRTDPSGNSGARIACGVLRRL